ncbi:ribose 5-phosphate isomerase B [Aquihabitans sp. G128]|uniref:ribose 5-phosphate isomerase B n=1 Tax=Aquihabitans sp. G128 TaxID=2849779 RepID=UPI001C224BAD|nr:ribose 5-phosphate isomerase B [Aquihabitans sp. G128]QXC63171.1 ribose 5-phosphate isomerase B [Aquihabitans sp. G128]
MRIAIGADHAGFDLKEHLVSVLRNLDHTVLDLGTDGLASVDYPAYCAAVGRAVVRGDAERGIVLGGSGQGEQIAANKVAGVRAALCNDLYTARMAREHNDANVLSIGGRIVAPALADEIVVCFLQTPYQGGRHQRRVDQLGEIGAFGTDGRGLDAYLEALVPGIAARSSALPQGDPR